jgi:hypothetical protein
MLHQHSCTLSRSKNSLILGGASNKPTAAAVPSLAPNMSTVEAAATATTASASTDELVSGASLTRFLLLADTVSGASLTRFLLLADTVSGASLTRFLLLADTGAMTAVLLADAFLLKKLEISADRTDFSGDFVI